MSRSRAKATAQQYAKPEEEDVSEEEDYPTPPPRRRSAKAMPPSVTVTGHGVQTNGGLFGGALAGNSFLSSSDQRKFIGTHGDNHNFTGNF